MCMAVGKVSFDDWDMLTSSLGWIGRLLPSSPPASAMARFPITSFAFMFECVPDPVCHTNSGKWSSNLPSTTSSAARTMRSALSFGRSPSSAFTRAALFFNRPKAHTISTGIRSSPIEKWRSDRSVCAPQYLSAGTSISPKLSDSMRVPRSGIPPTASVRDDALEDPFVPGHHRFLREQPLDPVPALLGIDLVQMLELLCRLLWVVLDAHDPSGDAVHDDLGNGASRRGDDRRAARHGFGHDQAEGLRPVDGEQNRLGPPQQVDLLLLRDLTQQRPVLRQDRLDVLLPLFLFGGMSDLHGRHEVLAGELRCLDGPAPSLLRRRASQEQDEVFLLRVERVEGHVDAVVDDPAIPERLVEPFLGFADGDEPRAVADQVVQSDHLRRERAVQRVDGRYAGLDGCGECGERGVHVQDLESITDI